MKKRRFFRIFCVFLQKKYKRRPAGEVFRIFSKFCEKIMFFLHFFKKMKIVDFHKMGFFKHCVKTANEELFFKISSKCTREFGGVFFPQQ